MNRCTVHESYCTVHDQVCNEAASEGVNLVSKVMHQFKIGYILKICPNKSPIFFRTLVSNEIYYNLSSLIPYILQEFSFNWDYIQACFFALTILTTIGGTSPSQTEGGREDAPRARQLELAS